MINILKMNAKILREIKSRVSAQVTVKMWIAYLLLLIPRIRRGNLYRAGSFREECRRVI
jgi:hypothetical protein